MAETIWFDGDEPMVPARLVEDEDGDWAISSDPGAPVAGHVVQDGEDFNLVPGAGDGFTVNLRFASSFILLPE